MDTSHGEICASSGREADDNPSTKIGHHMDVGTYSHCQWDITGEIVKSNELAILHDKKEKIGTGKFTGSAIAFAPRRQFNAVTMMKWGSTILFNGMSVASALNQTKCPYYTI